MRTACSCLLLLALASSPLALAGDDVEPCAPMPAETQRRIEGLIDDLAQLARWQGGLSPSRGGGVGFAPAGGERYDEAYRALVALGPDALPFLLAHLDDRRETKLAVAFEGGWGGLSLALELEANPTDWEEIAAIRTAIPRCAVADEQGWPCHEIDVDAHAVTVGDACFAILGEITNRVYEAVRYQPSAITIVNSPTRRSALARAVRAQWIGRDYRQELYRRLRHDLRTPREGSWRAELGDLQSGALLRLAWYYPEAVVPELVAMLEGIDDDVLAEGREPMTGLDLEPFLQTVLDLESPVLRAALAPLLDRVRDPELLWLLLVAFPERKDAGLLARIRASIESVSDARLDPVGNARHGWVVRNLLRTVGERWPEREGEVLTWHFRAHGFPAARDLVEIAYERDVDVPLDVWAHLLDMREKAVTWRRGGTPHPLERLRVCDVAALRIASRREDLPFAVEADVEARDAAIRHMRDVLAAEERR